MHSKQRYKICSCSVILGELEPFPKYKGCCIIFPKILDAVTYYESENFSDSLHHIFESEHIKLYQVSFLYEKQPNQGSDINAKNNTPENRWEMIR